MISFVQDYNLTDALLDQLSIRDAIANDIKKEILEILSTSGGMDESKANSELSIVVSPTYISINIGGLGREDPLTETQTEDEFYNTSQLEDAFYDKMNESESGKKDLSSLKNEIEEKITEVVRRNIIKQQKRRL